MSVSAPHNATSVFSLDAAQLLQLVEAAGALATPPGAVYRGCRVVDGRVEFSVSYCDEAARPVRGLDLAKTIEAERDIRDAAARDRDRLMRALVTDDPGAALAELGVDYEAEQRAIAEESKFVRAEEARVAAETAAVEAPPRAEPPAGVGLSEAFGRAVYALHNTSATGFGAAVRTAYEKAHAGPADPSGRRFSDRAAVLENHPDKTPFLLPFLDLEPPAATRARLETFLAALAAPAAEAAVLRAALELWFARRAAGAGFEVVRADDQWFSLTTPNTRQPK